ncbi:MAG: hypothetical protein KA118_13455 [Verrucomicrobia bacterium]|nr:hypothetical protein [Verrucomicrobiota bacterium]
MSTRIELFDCQADPDETRDHTGAHPEVVRAWLARLDRAPRPGSGSD